MFINYAHRGASEYAPENTMSAFDMALKLGANGIELDLQMTKDAKIVLFEDFAKKFLPKKLTFAIELKEEGIEKETFNIIKKYATHDNIYITSFNYKALENMRKIDSNIKLSWLIEEKINKNNIDKLLKINGTQICPKADNVTKDDIELANKSGLRVRLWGILNEEIMENVYKLDIDGMTVNFPDKLQHLMEVNNNE